MAKKSILREHGINTDLHWQEVMALAKKYGFIYHAGGGVALLMTHKNQIEQHGEAEYLRIQQMNGHCPKTFGYEGCQNENGSVKDCGSCCWAAQKPDC